MRIQDDHQCKLRRRFSTKDQAQAACNSIAHRQGVLRRPEGCRYCNGWHLSDAK